MFATAVVLKLLMWAVTALGLYVVVRALLDGEVLIALLLLFIIIPIVLWGARIVLTLSQIVVLVPLALVTRRMREFREFTSFQLAVVDSARMDRLNLRQGRKLLSMFKELPPPQPGQPTREGWELLALYENLHADDDLYEDDDLTPDQERDAIYADFLDELGGLESTILLIHQLAISRGVDIDDDDAHRLLERWRLEGIVRDVSLGDSIEEVWGQT